MNRYISKKTIIIIIAIIAIISSILIAYFAYMDAIAIILDGWKPNIVIAVLSLFIAACVLGVTIWQGLQNRKHNRLSVLPLLGMLRISGGINYEMKLINRGVGPAIIKNFELLFDGKIVSCNDYKAYRTFFLEIDNINVTGASHYAIDDVIKVGEELTLWHFEKVNYQDISYLNKITFRVEYYSIYRDKTLIFDSDEHDKLSG